MWYFYRFFIAFFLSLVFVLLDDRPSQVCKILNQDLKASKVLRCARTASCDAPSREGFPANTRALHALSSTAITDVYKIADFWHVRHRRLNSPAFACSRASPVKATDQVGWFYLTSFQNEGHHRDRRKKSCAHVFARDQLSLNRRTKSPIVSPVLLPLTAIPNYSYV